MSSPWTKRALRAAGVLALLTVGTQYTIVWFKSLEAPAVRVGLLWSALAIGLLLLVPIRWFRLALGNFAAVILAVTAFEAFSEAREGKEHPAPPSHSIGYFTMERGDALGYGPARPFVDRSVLERSGRRIYDVTYTIDERGLRVSPPEGPQVTGTILLFGDSFTFGEGVADTQTMPYQVGLLTGGRQRVYNFAFHGYGPHQVLSSLETGLVQGIVQPKGDVVAIYQAIPDHARRAAGLAFYDAHGPRYTLDPKGRVHRDGHFDDEGLAVFLRKVQAYRRIVDVRSDIDSTGIQLFAAIVARARDIVEGKYPGAKFHVLFWDTPADAHTPALLRALRERGLAVHLMSQVLPGYPAAEANYVIPLDGHPNPRAHRLIAQYVVAQLLEARQAGPSLVSHE